MFVLGETLLLLLDLHAVRCSARLRSFSGNNTEVSLDTVADQEEARQTAFLAQVQTWTSKSD